MHALIRTLTLLALTAGLHAQSFVPGKVEIPWNRYYDYDELLAHQEAIAEAYPDLVELREIGRSLQGRPLVVAIVTDPATGAHTEKPAMWIDGNVHGNEIQSAEVVLYTLWTLTRVHGHNDDLTRLLREKSVYLLLSQNPDGRAHWFSAPNTPHSSRRNQRPFDSDLDGLFDEDGYDDLDGDGSITSMWREDPTGRWRRNPDDPRIFERVADDEIGGWERVGSEGIDNDGDGRINEDGPGGDDMNRSWPSDWQPECVQGGAGPYPLSHPETRAIADFILAHPNIAGSQSYHNTGGMILRGPGAKYEEGSYDRRDLRVYDELARKGIDMLPYYRYLIIHKDLYAVHGGFVNWMAEGLGIISYTNEMWTPSKYFQRDISRPDEDQTWLWRDRLAFGDLWTDYTEFDHPTLGKVLIGGSNKWASRVTPTFMLEEECHRNFAFTMLHADEMPVLDFTRHEVKSLGGNLWQVTVELHNERLIPTRTSQAHRRKIGKPDLLLVEPAESAIAAGRVEGFLDPRFGETVREPARIQVPQGISGRGYGRFRLVLRGEEGTTVTLRYQAEKAKNVALEVVLRTAR